MKKIRGLAVLVSPWAGVLLFFAMIMLTGCQKPGLSPMRLGVSPWPGYEFLFLAQEMGFFQQAGLSLRLVEFSSLSDARRAYEEGLVDGIAATLVEVVNIQRHSSRQPRVVLALDFSQGSDVILARSPVASIRDLVGKKVGVEPASLGGYLLRRAMEKAGIGQDRIQVVASYPLRMEQQLLQGELAAVVTYPPFASRMLRHPEVHALFSSADIPGEVVDVLVLDAQVVRQRAQDVHRLLAVWDQTLQWYRQTSRDAIAVMARREGVTAGEFEQALTEIHMLDLAEQVDFFQPAGLLHQVLTAIHRLVGEASTLRIARHSAEVIEPFFILHHAGLLPMSNAHSEDGGMGP